MLAFDFHSGNYTACFAWQVPHVCVFVYLFQFHKLQMRLHTDQVMLEQVQEENQRLNQQVVSLTAAFMALQKMVRSI